MAILENLINFNGQTLFKVLRNESLTIPDSVTASSPTGLSSGVSPTTIFDSRRAAVGGMIFAAFNDAAGPASLDVRFRLQPGDVVAVSNANPAVVTINGETVASIANSAVAGVLGFYA